MTPDIFGPPSHQPFGFYDPASLSVRTSQDTLLSDSTKSSPTLPKWGCLSGGALYELPTPALLTNAHGSFGLPFAKSNLPPETLNLTGPWKDEALLLPTPAVNDMGAGKTPEQWDTWTAEMQQRHANGNGHGRSLSIEAQRLLPTLSASDSTGGNNEEKRGGAPGLRAVGHLLPTPTAQAAKHGETPDLTANGAGYNLWDLPRLLPTMMASNDHGGELRAAIQHGPTRRLPGEPTSLPSDDGKQSTEPPHGQLTIEDA